MQKIIIACLALALSGCVSYKRTDKPLSEVTVARGVKLKTSNVWPLKNCGTYLQKVTATVKGQTQTFSVHLTIAPNALEAVAFNDLAGRLYTLKWTPNAVIWEGSPHIPLEIMPENIIADFLLTQLPIKQLQENIKGAKASEKFLGKDKVRGINNEIFLRSITFERPQGNMWMRVIIYNHAIGYQLDIQTVVM